MPYLVCNPRPTQPNTVSASLGYLIPPLAPRYRLLILTVLTVKKSPIAAYVIDSFIFNQ